METNWWKPDPAGNDWFNLNAVIKVAYIQPGGLLPNPSWSSSMRQEELDANTAQEPTLILFFTDRTTRRVLGDVEIKEMARRLGITDPIGSPSGEAGS